MRGLRWVRLALLLVAAVRVSGSTEGDDGKKATIVGGQDTQETAVGGQDTQETTVVTELEEEEEKEEEKIKNPWTDRDNASYVAPVPAESQQVYTVVAGDDLHASETGYGKGKYHKGHKGYKGGYHDKESYKGKKGYKADKGHKKSHYGDYGKDRKKGYHDKGGKHYKGHDDKHKYYGEEHKGKKGKKGHHYGSKGHHDKGHKDKGYKNVYHKEEYHHQKKFYDDFDRKKYHDKYDDYDSYFKSSKGKDYKGGKYKGRIQQTFHQDRSHSEESPKQTSVMLSRVRAALRIISDTTSNSRNENSTGIEPPPPNPDAPQTSVDVKGVGTMRYVGRVLLDVGETSRGRARYQEKNAYDEQCQVSDLRMIRRYLRYCLIHAGEAGPQKEGAPPCTEDDLGKIKKYLSFCQRPFFTKASKSDKRQYRRLITAAKKLHKRNNIIEEDDVYEDAEYAAEICNVGDLRQIKSYLTGCYSGKEATDGELPSCDLPNYHRSLDYLSFCQTTFFAEASRKDKRLYDRLTTLASSIIQWETERTANEIREEEKEQAQEECQVSDLREAKSYVSECQKLMQVPDYQTLYGRQVCRRSHLKKINKYLLGCQNIFLTKASRRDKKIYTELISTTESLSERRGKQKHDQKIKKDKGEIECKLEDLRKVPEYLKTCDNTQSCKIKQLSRVHKFLVECEDPFLKSASRKEKRKYGELVLKSEMLSTRGNIREWIEATRGEKKRIESICKIHVLRKVPKYLKGCLKSRQCKIKKLLKVQKFLAICENFFTIAASPKDRGKYERLFDLSQELVKRKDQETGKETQKEIRKEREMRQVHKMRCTITDLRKIPKYLDDCIKLQNCKRRQLTKVYKFLFFCEIPFTSTASQRDRQRYRKLLAVSRTLSTKDPGAGKRDHQRPDDKSKCPINDLRKIPIYLNRCQKSQKCKSGRLLKIQKFLSECKEQITANAKREDRGDYNRLERIVKAQIKVIQKAPQSRKTQRAKKRESGSSECQNKDLREVSDYLQKCRRSGKCQQRQLSKVYSFMTACKNRFTRNASERDQRKYAKLMEASAELTSRQRQRRGERLEKASETQCRVKELRRINRYLGSSDKDRKHIGGRSAIRMQNYLTTCKKTLLRDASRRDKKRYERMLISLSKMLKSKQISKDQGREGRRGKRKRDVGRREEPKRDVRRHRKCRIQDLRKVTIYLSKCKGKRGGRGRDACAGKDSDEISKFLINCKTGFFKRASKSDKRQYAELITLSRKGLRPGSKRDAKSKTKDKICKVKKLRTIKDHIDECRYESRRGRIKHRSKRTQNTKNTTCKKTTLTKIQTYLKTCQKTFLEKASSQDKRTYKHLMAVTANLSKKREQKKERGLRKTPQVLTCGKKDLRRLQRHFKHCRNKAKSQARKSNRKRDARVVKRRFEKRVKRVKRSSPTKSRRRTRRIENARRKSREARAKHKNRQGGKYHDKHGKKGHHEKGKYHDDHKGHKGHYDHKGHYGDKSSYGQKGGHKGEYGHHDHKGHGHDDHHGHGGYGHDDHHGHGYGHGGHHGHGPIYYGPRMPMFCFRGGYGHDDHGGHGSHSNIKPVSTRARYDAPAPGPVYSAPAPIYSAPVYVPAPSSSNAKTSQSSGFQPSPKLVVPPLYRASPSSASLAHPVAASGAKIVEAGFGFQTPKTYNFESFGDFGKFS